MLNKNISVKRNFYAFYATKLPKEDTYDQDKVTHVFSDFSLLKRFISTFVSSLL